MRFVDTNVLIHAVSPAPGEDEKCRAANDLFRAAAAMSRRFQLSYWDGAILAAARTGGCDIVYSEDLSAEQDYGGLRIINPFAEVR
ncbi:MAG: PIN domain-containing protein [Gemmatimonadales bacterium]|nr:PIN domain-containing protein [Gemmatimonadales bacterium]MYG20755.1 PIN domain-containing protein [Gemmatimonadales bacterium]